MLKLSVHHGARKIELREERKKIRKKNETIQRKETERNIKRKTERKKGKCKERKNGKCK